jgi:hypothetical protein
MLKVYKPVLEHSKCLKMMSMVATVVCIILSFFLSGILDLF